MKESIAALSADRRLQLMLIAFCFGAFLEGTGGGGAPVAIAGAFLIGLGFTPFQAATLCLVANTAPVAWGGVGNPIRVLAGVTGLPEAALERHDGADPAAAVGDPAVLAGAEHGRLARDVRRLAGAGGQRPVVRPGMQFYWSNYQETGLVDIVAALFSLLVMVAFLKVWRPTDDPRSRPERHRGASAGHAAAIRSSPVLKGWSPFLLASVLIFLVGPSRRSNAYLNVRRP